MAQKNSLDINSTLNSLGIKAINLGTSTGLNSFGSGENILSYSPVDGKLIGKVSSTTATDYDKVLSQASKAFKDWRKKPAPLRGERKSRRRKNYKRINYSRRPIKSLNKK